MGRVIALTLLAVATAPLHANPTHHATVAPTKKPSSAKQVAKRPVTAHPVSVAARVAPMRASARPSSRVPLHAVSAVRVSTHALPTRVAGGHSWRSVRVVHTAPAPTYQLHPDPDRYVEIQKALADKGYFKGEPNGEWGDDSTDAMRRFQADSKIDDDGKIDALSLISLGLGPRHDGSSVPLPAAPIPVVTPAAAVVSSPR